MNNKGGIPALVIFGIWAIVSTLYLKGAESIDKNVVNKERYKTQTPNFREGNNVWEEKLKIETNVRHDANTLPIGLTVDTEYKAPVE